MSHAMTDVQKNEESTQKWIRMADTLHATRFEITFTLLVERKSTLKKLNPKSSCRQEITFLND